MIIISGGKGIGKTKMLLEHAEDTNGIVACVDPNAMRLRAYKYGITCIDIISYAELVNAENIEKPVYIHDINKFLVYNFGNVVGYTQCNE
jgi:hypothetical protein